MSRPAFKRLAFALFLLVGGTAAYTWFVLFPSRESIAAVAFFSGAAFATVFLD